MPIVVLDGPEAAGKSTIIDALSTEWGVENSILRSWGPRDSWLEYCQPLFDDIRWTERNPQGLVIWSRCWASRTVYNKLLHQGQIVPREVTQELDSIVLRSGGYLGMVTSPAMVLLQRRLRRIESGDPKSDHQLDVGQELAEFQKYSRGQRWIQLSGTTEPEQNVRSIINTLVLKNPECRMVIRREDSLSE